LQSTNQSLSGIDKDIGNRLIPLCAVGITVHAIGATATGINRVGHHPWQTQGDRLDQTFHNSRPSTIPGLLLIAGVRRQYSRIGRGIFAPDPLDLDHLNKHSVREL
jgi:hypothetical protein